MNALKIYIIYENCDGRIYELYLKKSTAERVLESLNKWGIEYFMIEHEVEED